jgi:uncharacterized membrane protein
MLAWFGSGTCQEQNQVYSDSFPGLLGVHSTAIYLVEFAEVSFLAAVLLATTLLRVSSPTNAGKSSTKKLKISFFLLWFSTLILMFTYTGYLAVVYSKVDVVDEDIPDDALTPVAIYVAYCAVYLLTAAIAFGVGVRTLSKRPVRPQGGVTVSLPSHPA